MGMLPLIKRIDVFSYELSADQGRIGSYARTIHNYGLQFRNWVDLHHFISGGRLQERSRR